MLHATPVLELRSMPEGIVEGLASSFGGVDAIGDTVAPGAYKQTLAEHKQAGTAPALLWMHDSATPVGRWTSLAESSRGLQVSGKLNLKTIGGQQAFEHLSHGDLSGLSIGFTINPGGSESINPGGGRLLKSVKLHEVSLVTLAADPGARITHVKSQMQAPKDSRELQTALQGLGFSRRDAARIAHKSFGELEIVAPQPDSEALFVALRALSATFKG